MMHTSFSKKCWTNQRLLGCLFCIALLTIVNALFVQAGAPSRAVPYKESACNTDANIFFCEDFEGADIHFLGNGNCSSKWGNPALAKSDYCWGGGGSYQFNTVTKSPENSTTNHVWRITKTKAFTDVVTGVNAGTGTGTVGGYLNTSLLGTAAKDFYARFQVWFSADHHWPDHIDLKVGPWPQPLDLANVNCPSGPASCPWQTGTHFAANIACGNNPNPPPSYYHLWDSPGIRYTCDFGDFPSYNADQSGSCFPSTWQQVCPPLAPGAAADGTHLVRLVKERWYTIEFHVKLSTGTDGVLEQWIDGQRSIHYSGATCGSAGCPPMSYVYITGYMNSQDTQAGYLEIDNVVMSRAQIGPPGSVLQADITPPAAPTNLTVQ